MSRFHPLDFRLMAMSQFQILTLLCQTAASTISSDLNQFLAQQIITNQALSLQVFEAQVIALVEQMQATTLANVKYIDQLVSQVILNSQIMSALNTNSYLIDNPLVSNYYIQHGQYFVGDYTASDALNVNNATCSCTHKSSCAFQAGFYNYSIRPASNEISLYQPSPPPMFIVPGMLVGCLPHDSMLQSTLECFYNRSCLDLIGISQAIIPLNASVPSRFGVNTTVNTMFEQLFVETWQNSSNFTNYYNACHPEACSYTYTQRGNFLYTMTMLFSLIGGFTTILGILVPLLVQFFRRLLLKCQGEAIHTIENDPEVPNIGERLLNLVHRIRQLISTFNMFETSFSTVNLGIQTTRLYIFLTLMGAFILFGYSILSVTTVSVTIQQPSLDTFEKLYARYSSTLVCPCTGLSVTYDEIMTVTPQFHQLCSSDFVRDDRWLLYFIHSSSVNTTNNSAIITFGSGDFRGAAGTSLFLLMQTLCETANTTVVNAATVFGATKLQNVFLSVSPRLHQVCSSDFVAEQWWGFLWGMDTVSNFRDLQLLSIQFRVLASLCLLAQQSIDNDKSEFLNNKLITVEAISFSSFQAQIDSLTATFIVQTPDKFRRTQSFIYETFRANQLLVVPATDWQLAFTTAAYNYVIATVPRSSFGNNYSCITSLDSFSRPLYIDANYKTTTLPGVVASCLPVDGIRLSTLECFFNSNCILNLTSIASTRNTTIWIPKLLNASTPSIYPSNTSIGSLADSLFVEDWGVKSNYSSYFASCAPHSCSYQYIDHNTIFYIITTVLGLYGGLTVILRFIVWRGWHMHRKIMGWMQIAPHPASTQVVPFQPTIHIG
ncbi:unnamed protein product [Adineta steineri]|uniref:Uncharacterized protein n=1 Tax=Adineta steineri TaxID=433720 RepID=A0A819RKA6_9BILA|nr:unnamed protein product [Adineta steineri]CAF4046206.1 unnamed protein product [Adineta steineri]